MVEVIWAKQAVFLKLEKMNITKKMAQFYIQNKIKQKNGDSLTNKKSDENEQLTEISKNYKNSPNKSAQISIRKEEEEEKKINDAVEIDDNKKKSILEEEKKEESYESMMCEWWKGLKKKFVLENIFSVIKFLNFKLDGITQKELPKKVFFYKNFFIIF